HQREGVDGVVAHHEEIDVLMRPVGGGEQSLAERVDVVVDLRIVDVVLVDAHVAHDAVADGALLLLRKRGGGRIAQVRQRLRAARCRGEADRECEEEGAYGQMRVRGAATIMNYDGKADPFRRTRRGANG